MSTAEKPGGVPRIGAQAVGEFSAAAKQAVYDAIALRRDVRAFRPDAVTDDVLLRILTAAHQAGSVGFMQPWDFVVVRSADAKARVYDAFRRANDVAATRWQGDRRARYAALKLQGILDAPLGICVTCNTLRGGPHVLGRDTIPQTDVYSTCLAVQNLWLAARAEGVGVGWVSIVDNHELSDVLRLPDGVIPVAYLCVGYPVEFPETPLLEATGWRARLRLADLVHFDAYGAPGDGDLLRTLLGDREWIDPSVHTSVSVDELLSAGEAASACDGVDADAQPSILPLRSVVSAGSRQSADLSASTDSVDVKSEPNSAVSVDVVDARRQSGARDSDHADDAARSMGDAARVTRLAASVGVPDADRGRATRVRERLDALTKPRGSLGRLEELAVRLAVAQGRDFPRAERKAVLVFAGDNGVCAAGVSAYRADVTARLCYNFVAGGGAVNALARSAGAELAVVDVGVDHDFGGATGIIHHKIGRGTRNLAAEDAMTRAEAERAIAAGAEAVRALGSCDVLAVGEVGIGNTTSAAALLALVTDASADEVVGAGTGVGSATLVRKADVVRRAVDRCAGRRMDAIERLAAVGGFEIAALAGAMLAAAERRIPVMLDGFITGVAALVAAQLAPNAVPYLIASHRSAERGHAIVLDRLGLKPLLELDLRLGEGSGAVLALPLTTAACALLRDVRTFREAGMDEPLDPRGQT